jgi:hypothetical protein
MKTIISLLLVLSSTLAHAQLLVPKGAKGQLKVEYVFASSGGHTTSAKDSITQWRVRRVVNLTAQYTADAPQAFGSLHTGDGKQQADLAALQSHTTSAAKKLQPMAMDMQAMAAKCGVSMESGEDLSKAQEACIEKGVSSYANNLEVTPEIKSAGADVAAASQAMKATRFQLWQVTSQSGTYLVDEEHHKQVFEMTCTATKVCKRDDIRKGGGVIPAPPGGKSASGVSLLEVDTVNKDMVLMMPVPLLPLAYTQTVTTSIPDETGGTTQSVAPLWLAATKQITVSIPSSVAKLSGTQTIPVAGDGAEGGTITVTWQFTRQ